MCLYCRAASAVLDALWEEPDIREHFQAQGASLHDLGRLTHEVFADAYCFIRANIDPQGLSMLEADVTTQLLTPFYDRSTFREVWEEWDEPTRDAFIREQLEEQLARLLIHFYFDEFAGAFKTAYAGYRLWNP